MQPIAIVLHGPTSAGKSSLARALQNTAQVPAFHVSLDAFVTMSRRRDMRDAAQQQRAYQLHCENLCSTVARLVDTEFEIIVDFVLRDEAELQRCFAALAARPIYMVAVRAPLVVLEAREQERADRADGMAREQFAHPAFDRTYDLVIDTSVHSPNSGATAIRDFVSSHPH